MTPYRDCLAVCLCLLCLILPLAGQETFAASLPADEDAKARTQYRLALASFEAGDLGSYRQLRAGLKDYVLYPYLLYRELDARLDQATDAEIAEFLEQYADTPLADSLRQARLKTLARRAAWPRFLALYDGSGNTAMQCYALQAELAMGGAEEAILQESERLFTVGYSQPKACDPLFALLDRRGRIDAELVWRRIDLVMAAGRTRLASY